MPLYEGETLKEAIQKAVRGEKTLSASDCSQLERTLEDLDDRVEELRRQAQSILDQLRPLRRERSFALARLGLETSLMTFAVGRLVKTGNIIRQLRKIWRSADEIGRSEMLLQSIAAIWGVLDLISLANRISELDEEIQPLARDYQDFRNEMNSFAGRARTLGQEFERSECWRILRNTQAAS